MEEYIRGSIMRVTLCNFMTHSYCELKPGPRLNMIIGPNGSGKSSMLCAISLGLGGEPKDLGRSNQASAYIKNGETECWIEIELMETVKHRCNPIVKRVIRKGESANSRGSTTWFWNDEKVTLKAVLEKLKDMNTNVSNLCQVLPQDRVGDFSKFDPVTLLNETIRASLSEKYIHIKEDIYELLKKIKINKIQIKRKAKDLEKTEKMIERLGPSVEELQNRKIKEELMELLCKMEKWYIFQSKRCCFIQREEEFTVTKKLLKKLLSLLKEKQDKRSSKKLMLKNKKVEYSKSLNAFKQSKSNLSSCVNALKKGSQKITTEYMTELRYLKEEEDNVEANIAEAEIKVEQIKSALGGFDDISDIKARLKDLNFKKRAVNDKIVEIQQKFELKRLNVTNLESDLHELLKDEKLNKNVELKTKNFIRDNFDYQVQKTYDAVKENLKSFNKPVKGPIFLEVEVQDPIFAKFSEALIRRNLIDAYVTQNAEDRRKLNKTKTNTLNVEIEDESGLQYKKFKRLSRYQGAENLKQYGITGFGFEFIKCDPIVKEAIYRVTDISGFLFATAKFDHAFASKGSVVFDHVAQVVGEGFRIMTPTMVHARSVSRYSGESMINSSPFNYRTMARNAPSVFFKSCNKGVSGIGKQRKSVVDRDRELRTKKDELQDAKEACMSTEKKLNALRTELKEFKSSARDLENNKQDYYSLLTKLQSAEVNYKKAMLSRSKNFSDDKNILKKKILSALKKVKEQYVIPIISKAGSVYESSLNFTNTAVHFEENAFQDEYLKQTIRKLESRVHDEEKQIKDEARAIKNEKQALQEDEKVLQVEIPLEEYQEKFKATGIKTLDALQAKMDQVEAELEQSVSDPSTLIEYRNHLKIKKKLEPEIEELKIAAETLETERNDKQKKFESAVKEKVAIINDKYVDMFETINKAGFKCEGSVKFLKNIPTTKDQNDLDNRFAYKNYFNPEEEESNDKNDFQYGIGIFVKFRASQQLELLNSEVQSGGERSLSTFLYLLSLQECSSAPFRVVDEINQGMDANKERLAFHCLVENSCRPNLPQYFLITPKLLTGFDFGKAIKINFVTNGNNALNQKAVQRIALLNRTSDSAEPEKDVEGYESSVCSNDSNIENTPISEASEAKVKVEIKPERRSKRRRLS